MKDMIIAVIALIVLVSLLVVMSGAFISSDCSRLEEKKYENSEHNHNI